MNKKMREIFAQIEAKTKEAQIAATKKDFDGAEKLMDEVDKLEKEFAIEKRIFEAEKKQTTTGNEVKDTADVKPDEEKSKSEKFVDFVKSVVSRKTAVVPQESTAANGGYIVPEDIQTKINYYKEAEFSLLDEISVENVSTNKGARTYQAKGSADVLTDLDENGAMVTTGQGAYSAQLSGPTFERITYSIVDRAGFLPVSNDLINDSTENVIDVITKWIGKSIVNTANAKILGILTAGTQTNLSGLKGIKKAVNVTLGQAYRSGVVIYTNDDGLDYLDSLDDQNGRPLLNPDPTAPVNLTLRCGATVIPVKVIPNGILETSSNKIPFIIGDLKEAVRKFDRNSVSIDASTVASIGGFNAYENNMTLLRCIVRDDYKAVDSASFVYGYVSTQAAAAEASNNNNPG